MQHFLVRVVMPSREKSTDAGTGLNSGSVAGEVQLALDSGLPRFCRALNVSARDPGVAYMIYHNPRIFFHACTMSNMPTTSTTPLLPTNIAKRPAALDQFEVQVGVSVTVLAFSLGMLATGRGEASVYLPVVTSIVSYWLPAPSRRQ